MTITVQTRKMLWGKSGNRCALCKAELAHPDTATGEHAVIGDEHHIHPQAQEGSDEYENLILLCPNDHRLVESRPTEYPQQRLLALKSAHEAWVRERLTATAAQSSNNPPLVQEVSLLLRIKTGKELAAMFFESGLRSFDEDEPLDAEETEAVARLFSLLEDWDLIYDEISYAERMNVAQSLNDEIEALEALGFWVFGLRVTQHLTIYGVEDDWTVAYVHIRRSDGENVVSSDDLMAAFAGEAKLEGS